MALKDTSVVSTKNLAFTIPGHGHETFFDCRQWEEAAEGSFPNGFTAKERTLANTRLTYLISGELSANQKLSALQRRMRAKYPDWVNPDKFGVAVFRGGGEVEMEEEGLDKGHYVLLNHLAHQPLL